MAIRNRETTAGEKPKRKENQGGLFGRKSQPAKAQQQDIAPRGGKSQNPIIRYFQETGDELRKVTWPTREQTIRLSTIVLVSTLAAAAFLGSFDLIFHELSLLLVRQ
jgi:preprotein translocase subunit SecE